VTDEAFDMLRADVQRLEDTVQALAIDVAVLKNTWALALKWGAGAGAGVAAVVSVWNAIWEKLG
jgi:hypothetical protein